MPALPLIPSAVIGSHGKPGWWFATVKKVEAGEYGPGDLDEMFDDAADTAIRDMERAGLDIITDGEVRRLDGYVDSYYAIIKGIEPLPVRRKAGPWGYDQQTRYEATGRIETPPGGLGIIKEFEYLKAHTAKRTKATCAGPLTFGSRIHPGKMYKGVVELTELDLWKEYGRDRELGAGVVDVKGFYPETPEDVARRIRCVLAVCPPEKLQVNPDCGFGWSPRYMCNQKIRALAAGAALVRAELTGTA